MITDILKNAYNTFDKVFVNEKVNGKYEGITYKDFITKSINFADYLISKGLKDKKYLLFSENNINLMIADLAIISYGGISISTPTFNETSDLKDIIESINVDVIVYSENLSSTINPLKEMFKDLTFISLQNDFDKIVKEGKKITDKKEDIFDFEYKDDNECSKIVFSSGSTSKPKAVMLSHKNIFFGYNSLTKRIPLDTNDHIYLYLPLYHTYSELCNFLYSFKSGMTLYLCSDIKNISSELQEVNPTVFCSVPYIYIKTMELAGDKLKYAFGNRLRHLVSGGAKLELSVKNEYFKNGLFILDTFAMTEASSSIAVNYPDNIIDDSCGHIYEDIELVIDKPNKDGVGEILLRGDNIFLGYANDPELTKRVIDKDKFFHTGDIGYVKDNKVYFVERIKPILITSKGENIDVESVKETISEILNIPTKSITLYVKNDLLMCDVYSDDELNFDLNDINNKLANHEKISVINLKKNQRIK